LRSSAAVAELRKLAERSSVSSEVFVRRHAAWVPL
jgi:hypothetical protein